MIEKPIAIVTSLGRTGTLFFAGLFREVLPEATSLHEPDIFTFSPSQGMGWGHAAEQIKASGFTNVMIRKPLGRFSLIAISDARVRGELSDDEAAGRIWRQRRKFIPSRPGRVYVESSTSHYGLLDLLPRVYADHRAAFVVRDGRDWVRSWMNWGAKGGLYSKNLVQRMISHRWPRACDIPDNPYRDLWPAMSWFERLCWAWRYLNEFGIRAAGKNPSAQVVRFEDLFNQEDGDLRLNKFVLWMTSFAGSGPIEVRPAGGWAEKKIHGSSGGFPGYARWTDRQREVFLEICGPLMRELNYWRE
ncbi:MAG: hypothetical protein AB1896_11130 [Thermodesulfobacteriota bacterium]